MVALQRGIGTQQYMQTWANGKAFLGQGNSGFEQLRPRQCAVLLVRFLQHAQQAWYTHRPATHHSVIKGHGLVFQPKQTLGGFGRSGFTAIKDLQMLAVVVQQKSTTANSAGLRLYQGQHHLHSNGRVYRSTTRLQHLVTRIAGQRVGRGHAAFFEVPSWFGLVAAGGLGQFGDAVIQLSLCKTCEQAKR